MMIERDSCSCTDGLPGLRAHARRRTYPEAHPLERGAVFLEGSAGVGSFTVAILCT